MQISSRFTIAVHIFACIEAFGDQHKLTSDFLAGSVNVNPVIIRKTMSQLQKAGLIKVARGTGGMKTKLSAAKLCNENGITVALISGDHPDLLYDAVEGNPFRGTRFLAEGAAK